MSISGNGASANGTSASLNGRAAPDLLHRGPLSVQPRVSVIVLNHNGERIIAKCLDHLLAQTFEDFEIMVVDNNSTDASLAIIEPYLGTGRLSIVRASRNLGVAGGRNLGMRHVQGSIIAFIDNDGFADPGWLAAAVKAIESDPRIGVAASVVFFAGRQIILNGAGGTVNLQGYGGDHCFNVPYEFARMPRRVLYAMGCGMVARAEVLKRIGPLDEKLFNYYDDTELGIRTWKSGYEVAVAPDAFIDHGFGHSDRILGNKIFLCERNRIRTVLKYFPILKLPAWFGHEVAYTGRLPHERLSIALKAWLWNLGHLPSALWLRLKFALRRGSFSDLLAPGWGEYPFPCPANQASRPDLARAQNSIVLDGTGDTAQLNFGWYQAERDHNRPFRWSAPQASALFRLRKPVLACTIAFVGSRDREARIVMRPAGSLAPCVDQTFRMPGNEWTWRTFPMHLPAGCYELLFLCKDVLIDSAGRRLGLAVSSIAFE